MSGNSFGRENVGKRAREERPVKFVRLRFILNELLKTIEITEFVVTQRRNSGDSRTKSCSKDRRYIITRNISYPFSAVAR